MAKERTEAARPIRLSVRSVDRVLVEPGDEDRFLMTAREAAIACKVAQDEKGWQETFDQFLIYVQKWCQAHSDKVAACYVGIGDGSLSVLVCTKTADYDFDFEDVITDLDLDLVKQFAWCIAEVMQVPQQVREGQPSLAKAILVYGDGNRAPATGAT